MNQDVLVSTAYLTNLVNGNLTESSFVASHTYLDSYSLDKTNPYASSVSPSADYSGYFYRVSS